MVACEVVPGPSSFPFKFPSESPPFIMMRTYAALVSGHQRDPLNKADHRQSLRPFIKMKIPGDFDLDSEPTSRAVFRNAHDSEASALSTLADCDRLRSRT